jgi:beta-lactamase superfamily II metal-dependent hydrolase
MYDGLEIDMLSLGDADCIVVTHWHQGWPQRTLVDAGRASDFPDVRNFLIGRGMTEFWAVVCTHPHRDHGDGLVKIVRDWTFTFHNAWMHDIRKHVTPDTLRRASAGDSSRAKDVKQVLDTTTELANAFAARELVPQEPFAGIVIAGYPLMTVLGPTPLLYSWKLGEFMKVPSPGLPVPPLALPLGRVARLSDMLGAPATLGLPSGGIPITAGIRALEGPLSDSSVQENPTTQPFNETSAIIGIEFENRKLLLTADSGSDGLDAIAPEWASLEWMQVPHHGSAGNLSKENIEGFRPKFAFVSAQGNTNHPGRAIVNGLIKMGATVCSTHRGGHLWYWIGAVPARPDYGSATPLKGTSNRIPTTLGSLPPPPVPGLR